MDTRGETKVVLAGLGVGLLLALIGIVGAAGGGGYLAVLLFLALLSAGAIVFSVSSLVQRPLTVGASMAVSSPSSGQNAQSAASPAFAGLPSYARGSSVYFVVLVSALALTIDVGLLALAGNLTAGVGLVAGYGVGVVVLFIASGVRPSAAEYFALMVGAVIVLAGVIGVLGGLLFSAVVGLGYLLAIASGYTLYRLDRSEVLRVAPVVSTAQVQHQEVKDGNAVTQVDIFQKLSREQRALVAKLGHIIEVRSGDILGRQGSQGEALYIILEGQAELTTRSPMGQLTVRIAGPGESLPLAALLGSGELITTALAFSDLRALVIPSSQLRDLCVERPDIGMGIFQSIAEILANRYRNTLSRFTQSMDRVLQESEFWANV